MKPSDVVETTLGTALSAEQARLINGFLVLSTPGYVDPAEAELTERGITVGRQDQPNTVRAIRRLAMQGLKAGAIAVQLNVAQSVVYRICRENEFTLNNSRCRRITPDLIDEALTLLDADNGVSVIGVAVEVDISTTTLERIIDGTHPVMDDNQRFFAKSLTNLNYHLIR
jgi:hypothetical protein